MSKTPRSSVGLSSLASIASSISGQTLVIGRHYLIDFSGASSGATVNLPAGSAGAVIQVTASGNLLNTYRLTVSAANALQKIYYDGQLYDQLLVSPTDYSLSFAWDDSGATGHWLGVDWPAQDASIDLSADVNLCLNPSDALSGWSYSGGGSATTDTATVPLGPAIQTSIRISGSASGDYAHYRWTMPSALLNRKLAVEWWQVGSGLTSGDFKVELYTNTSSFYTGSYTEISLSTDDTNGLSAIPNSNGLYRTSFDAASALYYELRVTRTGSGFKALYLAGVQIGHRGVLQGAAVSEWVSYTSNWTNLGAGTVTQTYGRYRRVGSVMHIELRGDKITSGSGSAIVKASLPTGVTFNPAGPSGNVVGHGVYYNASTSKNESLAVYVASTDPYNMYFAITDNTVAGGAVLLGSDFTNTSVIFANAQVSIAEWAGSGTVNVVQNDVEYAWNNDPGTAANTTYNNSAYYGYGPSGANFKAVVSNVGTAREQTSYYVRFQTPIQQTDSLLLEMYDDGLQWVPVANRMPVDVQGNSAYGMRMVTIDSYTVSVNFGNMGIAPSNTTYAGASATTWSAAPSYRWRVRKISGGQAVGFGLASATSAGLVSKYMNVVKTTTLQGATTAPSLTVTQIRVGDMATIKVSFPGGTFTKDGTAGPLYFAIDSAFTPATNISYINYGIVNNVASAYAWTVNSASVVQMYASTGYATIGAGTTNCGWNGYLTFTYPVV